MRLWNKISIHPLTLVLMLLSLLCGLFKYALIISSIVLMHEIGHIIAMLIFKRNICKIEILPFGGLIKVDSMISSNIFEDLIIAVSGIFMQVIVGLLTSHILSDYSNFGFYNKLIILFNMLPISPLDGKKIITLLLELVIPYKKVFKISLYISIITLSIIILNDINVVKSNILVFSFISYMCIKEYRSRKYLIIKFYLERINHEFKYKIKNILRIDEMYKNRVHIIRGMHEKEYIKCQVFSKVH